MRYGGNVMIRILLASAALAFATTMAQTAELTFYQLPPGSFPHDVAPAPDGTVWFSAQSQGFAGRFDPKTGQLEKIPLGSGAAPHGVIVGPDANAWLTRRTERDRAGRRHEQRGQAVPAAEGISTCQSQHLGLRQEWDCVVHRPEWGLRTRRSQDREG
jgi:streptogramin lyase